MSEKINNDSVRRNTDANRFEMDIGEELAVVDYHLGTGKMVITHTFVPPAARGQGVAEKLVRSALEAARTEGLSVVPECSYVAAFIKRHPEFHSLLALT